MRAAVVVAAATGCAGATEPALLCDPEAPIEAELDGWSGGGMVDPWTHFVSADGVRQHLQVRGDCAWRAYDVDETGGLPIARWKEGALTAAEAADIAERLSLGSWPASLDDAVPDSGWTHLSFDGDVFECSTCGDAGELSTALRDIVAERVAAGSPAEVIGVDVIAWEAGSGGFAPPSPTDWRFAWTLDRPPTAFVTADGSPVAAEALEIASFVAVLDEARAGALANGQFSLVTEVDGIEYQLWLRESVAELFGAATER